MAATAPDFDAIIVGSGFGGSICAARLAEAGKRVLVLERGQRWQPADFPRDVRDTDRLLWRWPRRGTARGLYDVRFFRALGAVVASGVGGGSLIYANIHIRPDARIFEDSRWPTGVNRATLDSCYDRVAKALGVAPLPPSRIVPKRDRFRAAAEAQGRDVFDPDEAVSWDDPNVPGRSACQMVAECEFGCRYGAKNTLDFTYLADAERSGAVVAANCAVTHVAPSRDGYAVTCRDTISGVSSVRRAPLVILAAGTLGTNELLLQCRAAGALPQLSDRLGHGYSANGDFLGSIVGSGFDLEPWNGPDVTSVISYFDAAPEFTMAAPTFNRAAMRFLAATGQGKRQWPAWLGNILWAQMPWLVPLICRSGLLQRLAAKGTDEAAARVTNLFAIGRDNAGGRARLNKGRLDVDWDYAGENAALVARMSGAMEAVARHYRGSFAPLVSWLAFRRILTVHSLGGCHLSADPSRGVVSPLGEVHGHPGLYVADGSVIPTSIGFHPCMTIAAVAERIAEGIVRRA
jgi:cholesterol oxidase